MTRRQHVMHTLISVLRWTGVRDRLRCPACSAVGTWKPHGGRFDRYDVRGVRRWLCKWCGVYVGPEGRREAYIDRVNNRWTLREDSDDDAEWTPAVALGVSPVARSWPWRG